MILRNELVRLLGGTGRCPGLVDRRREPGRRQVGHEIADLLEARFVVGHLVVGDATDPVVRGRTPEDLALDILSRGTLHQVGAAEAHEAGAVHHHDHVGERRQIRSSRDALSHDGRYLGHVQVVPHDRVVVEQAARAVLAREHSSLVRQVDAGRIDQVDDRHPAAHRYFLGSEHLRNRLRPPAARLDGGVIRHDHHGPSAHLADPGHDPHPGSVSVVLVIREEKTDLQEPAARVDQPIDALTRRELALRVLALDALRTAPFAETVLEGSDLFHEVPHA